MAKRKISKSSKRRLVILMPVVVFLIGYAIFTLVVTVGELYSLHHEEKELQENLTELKGDAEDLKTEINKLQDADYVARYARENYLYTKDGEYVIKVNEEETKEKKEKFTLAENYIIYGSLGLLALIILYIIIRHHRKKKKLKQKTNKRSTKK